MSKLLRIMLMTAAMLTALVATAQEATHTVTSGGCGRVAPAVNCEIYLSPTDATATEEPPVIYLDGLNTAQSVSNQGSITFAQTRGPNGGWLGTASVVSSAIIPSDIADEPYGVKMQISGNYAPDSGGTPFTGTLTIAFVYSQTVSRWPQYRYWLMNIPPVNDENPSSGTLTIN